ncbi:hypothetical protein ES703_34978 [subsurface metagenome]
MSLAELRDLFIVIFSLVAIGATLLLSILLFLLFLRVRSILNSGRETVRNVRDISSLVSGNIVKPLVGIASFLQGLRQALEIISGVVRRKEGKRSGREE